MLLTVSLILAFGATSYASTPFKSLNIKYHVSTDATNWFQAFINCKSAGMELASITTQEEQHNLEHFMKEHGYNEGYWLSGTNLGDGNFYWASTGTKVVYAKWLQNQPDDAKLAENDYKGENCIQWGIYRSSPNPIGWNDLMCKYQLKYICQDYSYCSPASNFVK
ncbi:C-type lectin 37Da-like [Cylas formicarius]|uniref:C-type lectin 37Da-like n=1 Tax=Cylas formicarius TaxID=197179 RepID=UPI0029583469|nr:C-type lectin 37Da-like [Cylas formicarius]